MRTHVALELVFVAMVQLPGLASGQQQAIPPGYGAIQGKVVDSNGNPVAGAMVYVFNVAHPSGRQATAYSNAQGGFYLVPVAAGRYNVRASKEASGFPDTFFAFYEGAGGTAPGVTVHDGKITKDVLVKLGRTGGTLRGQILDARTRQPVVGASIVLKREDDPRNWLSLGPESPTARFAILVPTVPFTVAVSAPGYANWDYGRAIQLGSGESKELVVLLRRVENPAQ
jgi:hypothetical protein